MQRVLRDLVNVVGLGDAIEISRRWGGREFNVPVRVNPSDPLALTLGYDTALKLVTAFGGVRLVLPKERNALIDLRNASIYRAVAVEGRSHETVGLEFGLTRQGINKVLRAVRERGLPVAAFPVAVES
jgi:hypothetical protein